MRATLSVMLSLASTLAYLGAAGLFVALLVNYAHALTHDVPATKQYRLHVKIGTVMLVLLVLSLTLSPRGSTGVMAAAAAVMVVTNLDLLRRGKRSAPGPPDRAIR